MSPVLGGARAALAFLTRIPAGGGAIQDAAWRWAPAFFPLVGALVGAGAALAWWATSSAGGVVAATIAVAASMLITGAFHEDGLADTADALGGAYDRDRLFEILKDSRVGTFGAAALVISIGLRIALVAAAQDAAPLALVLSHCFARVPPVWLMGALPYVTAEDRSRSPTFGPGLAQIVLASVWPAAMAAWCAATGAVAAPALWAMVAAGAGIALGCGWRFHARAGGITGDFLGATEQVCECAVLLVLAL
jgi:adenosylcobinamide-GDP ribazoletransferase